MLRVLSGTGDGYCTCQYWESKAIHQLWHGKELMRGSIDECVTDRHKLRPLVGGEDDALDEALERELAEGHWRLRVLIFPILLTIAPVAPIAEAKHPRSTAAKHAFQRENPCPATGLQKGVSA
jgi:hypothetical protein